jgi:hypothetical protein
VAPPDLARVDIPRRGIEPGRIRQQCAEQRRLALAVPADEHNFLAAIHDRREPRDDAQIPVGFLDAGGFEDRPP